MTCYKLYGTGVVTADGIATLDIVADGKIVGCGWTHRAVGPASGIASGKYELSFASSSGFTTNDTRSSFWGATFGAAVAANNEIGTNGYVALPDIPVNAGERLFLHQNMTGSTAPTSANISVWLYVEDRSGGVRRTRL